MPLQVIKTIIVVLYITFIYFTNDQLTWKYAIKSSSQSKDFTMRNSKCLLVKININIK